MSISLSLTKNAMLFLRFKASSVVQCVCGYCSMTCITLSALGCSKKAVPGKEGKETPEHMELSTLNNLCAMLSASKDGFSRLSYCNWAILI